MDVGVAFLLYKGVSCGITQRFSSLDEVTLAIDFPRDILDDSVIWSHGIIHGGEATVSVLMSNEKEAKCTKIKITTRGGDHKICVKGRCLAFQRI